MISCCVMDNIFRPLLVFGSTCIWKTFRTSSFVTLYVQFSHDYKDMNFSIIYVYIHVTKKKR